MTIVSLSEAQSSLVELVHRLVPGDEIVITENDRPVARLVASDATTVTGRPLSNERLLEIGTSHRPPASWYAGDEEPLF